MKFLKSVTPPLSRLLLRCVQKLLQTPRVGGTVGQARRAIEKGYASRMMLEISPDFKFAVLSPAFYGCEGFIATNDGAKNGCNFLKEGMCELHDTDFLPLECAFCHHERVGK